MRQSCCTLSAKEVAVLMEGEAQPLASPASMLAGLLATPMEPTQPQSTFSPQQTPRQGPGIPTQSTPPITPQSFGTVRKITSMEDLVAAMQTTYGLLVIQFGASWCGPCKQLMPFVEQMAQSNPQVQFVTIDTDEFEELTSNFKIVTLPTFVFFVRGKQMDVLKGSTANNFLQLNVLKTHIHTLSLSLSCALSSIVNPFSMIGADRNALQMFVSQFSQGQGTSVAVNNTGATTNNNGSLSNAGGHLMNNHVGGGMNNGQIGNNARMGMAAEEDDGEEAVVYQIVYGKPGAMGIGLRPHSVEYSIGGQRKKAHVPLVDDGPPGSPIKPGDILVSINGKILIADGEDSAGGNTYIDLIKSMIAEEKPPRVLRFFRSSIINPNQVKSISVDSPPSWLHERAAAVFLEG